MLKIKPLALKILFICLYSNKKGSDILTCAPYLHLIVYFEHTSLFQRKIKRFWEIEFSLYEGRQYWNFVIIRKLCITICNAWRSIDFFVLHKNHSNFWRVSPRAQELGKWSIDHLTPKKKSPCAKKHEKWSKHDRHVQKIMKNG